MGSIIPKRIAKNAHLRIIAPSKSGSVLSDDTIKRAVSRLEQEGFSISFSRHWRHSELSNVQQRLQDIHEAFRDPNVDGILTAIGGNNANELLDGIDYGLIRQNPKVFCGFSDITVLCNALFAHAGLVTYLGPHFSSWAMEQGFEYSRDYFLKATQTSQPFDIAPSENWSDDEWHLNQLDRLFNKNDDGEFIIREGSATGTLVGGNINGFCKLLNTKYKPSLKGAILLLEQGDETNLELFRTQLQAIMAQADFSGVRALVIGRFREGTKEMSRELQEMILNMQPLNNLPIVANVNLGHTTPIATFAIGGKCDIHIGTSVEIRMITH
jgi:muramoyltetrapeptide carboxypeptidase